MKQTVPAQQETNQKVTKVTFEEAYTRYHALVLGFAASRTPILQDAEDITQEAYLRLYLHIQDTRRDFIALYQKGV